MLDNRQRRWPERHLFLYDTTMSIQTILRVTAWLLFAAIVFATLSPLDLRPHSALPVNLERILPYIAAGFLFALAYRRHILAAAAFVIIAAIVLEVLQNVLPDRHGRETDAVVKVAGAIIGLTAGWLVTQLATRLKRN